MSSSADPREPTPGEHSSPRWSRLLEQSDDPLFVLNARRLLLHVNAAWERWANLARSDVRGHSCRAAKNDDDTAAILGLLAPTKEALGGTPSQVRRRATKPQTAWLDVHFMPWKKDGRVFAILGRIVIVPSVRAAKNPPLPEAIIQLRERMARTYRLELWESSVPAVQRTVAQARLASQTTMPILFQGPAGSGKEWLARTIHRLGPRREEYFACLDARQLPPSVLADLLLQSTTRLQLGAILIRNPASLRGDVQARLVELLDDDRFNPRLFLSVVDAAEAAQLSPELLARVSPLTIVVPPLSDRRADWPRLLPELLARAAASVGKLSATLSPEAEQALRLYTWPGNFRELDRTLRDALQHSATERIELADLPFTLRSVPVADEPKLPLDDLLQSAERRLIKLALEQAKNNKSKAAQLLGIWRPRLLRRMEQLGIADAEPPEAPHA